ncbi:MAG: 50S ribosomal protein L37ae [archaeon]
MAKSRHGSVKGLGSRYGRRIRHKLAEIQASQRARKKCPYCSKTAVKRVAVGIWCCRSCLVKFTGGAFDIGDKNTVKRSVEPQKEGEA